MEKVTFEVWYSMRVNSIPPQHRKDVLLADFMARGMQKEMTIKRFDELLVEYGVRIK